MTLFAQIPLAPPLGTRLIALIVVEVVLLALTIAIWIKYEQLKHVSVDEWWERRQRSGVSPRTQRMIRESREQYEAERRVAEGEDVSSPGGPPGS